MTWVRMDDQWPFNRKLLHVDPPERLMWAMSIAYASSQNTDGEIDLPMARMLAFLAGCDDMTWSAAQLVRAGLWDDHGDGQWSVHDYLDFNFSAAERRDISEQRAAAGRRGGTARASTSQANAQALAKQAANGLLSKSSSNGQANRQRVAKQTSSNVPSRPVPSHMTTTSSSSATTDDDDRVSRTLQELGRRDQERAIAEGVKIGNRSAHLAACVTRRSSQSAAVAALVAANPEWPPERLADEIDDPGGAERRAGRERALRAIEGSN